MLQLDSISFSYLETPAVQGVSCTILKGENRAIIGESGCGKSTLLKLVYGLYDLNAGQITYNGKRILGPKYNLVPGADYIKYLAQDFDLMPFITVAENIGKYLSNVNQEYKIKRVQELLKIVEMEEYYNVKAKFLSGGQQQRVALARVLALEPEILLLDEPFSQIDNFRKNTLRRNLFAYLKAKEITCLVATHDSTDALSFANRILVMERGKIIQQGFPEDIYNHPENKYTASLFGDVNEISSHYFEEDSVQNNLIFLYPHQLKITTDSKLKVKVVKSYFKGSHYLMEAEYENGILFFEMEKTVPIGTKLFLKK
jgi:ABC-type Fe3+/spermidine/putrescine transport system ATPase subunit